MTLEGEANAGFTSDDSSSVTQSCESHQPLRQLSSRQDVEAGPPEPPGGREDQGSDLEDSRDARQNAETSSLAMTDAWKDAETQTEGVPKTLNSWRILWTKSSSEVNPPEVDLVVAETRSLGFDASVQTRDALMFRYSDGQVCDMVLAWQVLTVFMPSTWHMILYVADQMTSVSVAVDLCSQEERWWCGLTVTFLILPSIIINIYAYEQ